MFRIFIYPFLGALDCVLQLVV